MKKLVAAIGLVFALSPLAMAQSKSDAKKAVPAVPAATTADSKKAVPAVPATTAVDSKKVAPAVAKAKKEPSEKQLAHRAKMKTCSNDASDKKLKGDERKQYMSTCLKA
jgi:hypothetical protein